MTTRPLAHRHGFENNHEIEAVLWQEVDGFCIIYSTHGSAEDISGIVHGKTPRRTKIRLLLETGIYWWSLKDRP